jgi:hypothetical protein
MKVVHVCADHLKWYVTAQSLRNTVVEHYHNIILFQLLLLDAFSKDNDITEANIN